MHLGEKEASPDEVTDKYPADCSSLGSALTSMIRSCLDKFITTVEQKYRASRVKLDEWVIIEMEPDGKRTRTKQPCSQCIWLELSDSDEE